VVTEFLELIERLEKGRRMFWKKEMWIRKRCGYCRGQEEGSEIGKRRSRGRSRGCKKEVLES